MKVLDLNNIRMKNEKVIVRDWKYHAKSFVVTFLTFFVPMVIVQINSTDFSVNQVEWSVIVGIGLSVFRAFIKAGIEALKPTLLALLKR